MRPSICCPSIIRIVTRRRSRLAKFRNASWMFGWLGAIFVSGRFGMTLSRQEGRKRALDDGDGGGHIARSVEPAKIRLFAEPDQLATRVPPVLLRNECACRRF